MARTKATSSGLKKSPASTSSSSTVPGGENYWFLSTRPLHSAVLLIPLVLMYELGAAFFLTDYRTGQQSTIAARKLISQFFDSFGAAALYLPGIAVITVMLVMHLVNRDRWIIRPWVLVGMVLESALWALPLIVFASVVMKASLLNIDISSLAAAVGSGTGGGARTHADPNAVLGGMSVPARLTIAIGAGLYEELLFRFVAITALHMVVKDLLQGGETAARTVAIVGSALAFAFYHPLHDPLDPSQTFLWSRLIFFAGAGVFFACISIFRGFGIVVYTHAIYDIIVLVVLSK